MKSQSILPWTLFDGRMFVSVIVTVRNEEETISSLLDSLIAQQSPFEIIIVDAESSDDTSEIVKRYQLRHENIHLIIKRSSRGEGRNFGVTKAKGEIVAFTDGGCRADINWLKEMRNSFQKGSDIVAGRTIDQGSFTDINRVKVIINEQDVTWPSCNLSYKKEVFDGIGGFDTRFITAEDIDLNLRAAVQGTGIIYNENAIIYRRSAAHYIGLMNQSFWYGYGRKQLTLKHGRLWRNYSPQKTFMTQLNNTGVLRILFGILGYLYCKISYTPER